MFVGIASVVELEVAEPRVAFADIVFVVGSWAAEPEAVFAAPASVADDAEPQASVDIAVAFDALVPVSVVAVGGDSLARPSIPAFPSVDHYATSSSSGEVVSRESVHSSTGARTSHDLCSIFSTPGLHQNKKLERCYSKPTPCHNNESGTNGLPRSATTNRSRKTGLYLYLEQRTHRANQATLSHPEVPEIRRVAAAKFQYLYPFPP
ncbi:MAG: hypothetical protein ACM3MB_01225 [Acidobacteriota bacterium]